MLNVIHFQCIKEKKMKAQIDVIDNMIVFITPLASRVFQKKKDNMIVFRS